MAAKDVICEAIACKNLLRFNYHNYDRIVEPHLLGRDRFGNYVLSAYLVGGFTQSSGSKSWRRYFVKEMRILSKLEEHFECPRKGYNPNDPWMERILCRLECL